MHFDRAWSLTRYAPRASRDLTGKYSHLNGVLDNTLSLNGAQRRSQAVTQKAGYQTAIVGNGT
jgi:arylsulfatase A-like enzyme